jgi:hypothetical protein
MAEFLLWGHIANAALLTKDCAADSVVFAGMKRAAFELVIGTLLPFKRSPSFIKANGAKLLNLANHDTMVKP